MAFVYNNKLPCYSWGGANTSPQATGAAYQLLDDSGGRAVPLFEYGAQQLFKFSNGARATGEATPCDVQMPWKSFTRASAALSSQVYGLTLHGEIYQINAENSRWGLGTRRMSRLSSSLVSEPFSRICFGDASDGSTRYKGIAITRSGKAYGIDLSSTSNYPVLREITLPTGVNAIGLWLVTGFTQVDGSTVTHGVYVLAGDDDKTYIRRQTSTAWYGLTGGMYTLESLPPPGNELSTARAWRVGDPEPTFFVDAPAGGVAPTLQVTWTDPIDYGANSYKFATIKITNPGSGYTADATVKTTATRQTYLLAKVFTETVANKATETLFNSVYDDAFCTATGKVWRFRVAADVDSIDFNWATDMRATVTSSGSKLNCTRIEWPYFLSTDGKIYKASAGSPQSVSLTSSDQWSAIASAGDIVCAIDTSNRMYTFGGTNSRGLYGDDTANGISRSSPVQVATDAEWVNCFGVTGPSSGAYFVAIRKDAICRSVDQPMEYWPDWYFQQQTA